MQRVNVSLLCLLSLLLASVAAAQTAVQPTEDVGTASLQDFSGGATIRGTYFDVRHQSGSGVGYRNGYTQIGAFAPFWLDEDSFIASNSRLLLTDTSDVGVNSGLVARRYSYGSDRIFGINGYFDSDMSSLGNRYQQATLGFETLGTNWDFRANGYAALGKSDRFIREICVGGNPFFAGNQLAFLGQQLREESLSGADFEFGFPVFQAAPWLRAYAGMYGYQSNSKEPIGVRGRMEAWVSDDLSVAVNVTDDRQFGTNVNAVVDFRFAGFRPTRYFPQWTTRERMLMPVQRNWRVATDTYTQNINIAAINPADGLPYFVSHINNTAAAGGDGSFEHPFNTLPASVPGADLILVAAGTTTEGAPLIGSIALQDNQRLLGEGKLHTANLFATYGGCVVNGNFVLPGSTNSGNYPFLSSMGNIITLANNNEVSGFNLLNAGGDAITNTVAGSNNFLLQCLEISGNNGRGINLQNATGTGIIRGVNLASGSTNHVNPGGFGNNLGGGIVVGVGAGDLDLSLTNVAMNSDPAGMQLFGIRLQEMGRTLTATLNNVQSSGNAGVGVQVLGDGGRVTLTATTPGGPLISNDNGGDNLNITLVNGTIFQGDIVNGQFNRSLFGSGVVYNHSGATGRLNLTNLQANGNAIDGIALIGSNATAMDVNVFASFLTNNGEDAIHVEGATGSTTALFVDATDARFNGRDGLFFNLNTATLNVTATSSLMDNNDRSAIFGQMDASIANLLFSNTTGNLSGADGLFLSAINGSTADIAVLSGTLANSGRLAPGLFDGVHIESDQSIVNLRMADTPANNTLVPPLGTQRHGMFLNIVNGSTFTGQVTNGNFTNSLENALNANFANNTLPSTLVLDNTPLDNSGGDGIHVTLTDPNTVATITLQNGSTNNNSGADGLDFNVNDGTLTVNALSSSFVGSGQTTGAGNGILGVINNTGLVNLNFSDTPITGSFNNGVFVTATGGSDIRAVFDNSPLNDNGLTTNGDGVRFDLDGSPGSSLALTNSQPLLVNQTNVNRNGGNGIELNASNGTVFSAAFNNLSISDNGQTAGGIRHDGVVVNVDGLAGADSTVNLTFNAATIINTPLNIANNPPAGTQQIGFHFNVQNGGDLTADFTASNLSSNIVNAFNGFVSGAGSTAFVTLDSTVADNSGADGAVLTALAGGRLDFLMSNASSINTSRGTGLVGTFGGANTLANISLDASTIDGSTFFGAFLDVSGGATLNLSGANISSISDSGLTGIDVTSRNPISVVNINFSNMSVDANGLVFGGAGLHGTAATGGTLNGCFNNTSFSGNSREGVSLAITDAASLGQFGVNTSVFDNNGREGLLVDVSNSGVLNYRSQNTSYSGNGATGAFDGVKATVTGTGPLDTTTTARFLFSTDTANNNTDDGFEFNANNGGTLVVGLDSTTATGNGGYGLNFNANDPGTKAYLLMTGANQLAPNTLGALNLNIGAIDTAVLSISGNFSNNNGDGLFLDLTGVTNAAVAIHGPGTTINGNGQTPFAGPSGNGDGIDIRMSGNTNGSILISGVTSINNNAADGIHIEMLNVLNGALEINGPTTINNSGDDAIDITLTGTNLVNGLAFPVLMPPVQFLTLGSNVSPDPLDRFNFCLPRPVNLDLAAIGVVPLNAFTINAITADVSVGRGINIRGVNSTIAPNLFTAAANDNGMAITNNVVTNTQAGDGLHIDFNNVTGPGGAALVGVTIDGNGFDGNRGNGINFDLVNSPIDQLTITNNSGGVSVNTGLGFTIIGNTFPFGTGDGNFNLINTSGSPTANVVSFTLNTSTSVGGAIFNTVSGANFPFTPFGGTEVTTGLQTVNGTAVPPFPPALVADFSQLLDLTFNGFQPGENFAWDNDFDFTPGGDETVLGSDLIGSTINVGFTGGLFLGGSLVAVVGDPTSSTFVATSGNLGGSGIANNGLDGIRFSLNNSSLTNLLIDNNTISTNGNPLVGHGINFQSVVNSNIAGANGAIISHNTIDGNAGDGFHLINPNTAGAAIGLTFRDNTSISTNTGAGINVQVNNAEVLNLNINSAVTGNVISGNTSFGVHAVGLNTSQVNLTVGGAGAANLLNGNGDAGIGLDLRDASTGSVNVSNVTISGTVNGTDPLFNGGGFEVRLADTAAVTPFTIGDAVLKNVTFSNNAANGFSLLLNDNSTANNLLIQNISSLQNVQNQVRIDRHANALVNVTMNDSTLTGSATSLDGFSYNATNFATATPLAINLNRNTISTNRDGVAIDTSANADVVANIVTNTISNNRNNGIRVTTLNASSFGDPSNGTASQLLGNTINNNGTADGAAGIRLIAQDVSFQNVLIGASGATRTTLTGNFDGIRISDSSFTNPFSPPDNNYQIQATSIVDSSNDGIQLDLSGAGTRVYIGNPTAATTAARNDVVISRTNPAPGGTGHGINVNAAGGANNVSIRNATIAYSGLSGVNVAQTGGDLTFNMQSTQVLFSGERGVFANITNNSGTTNNNYNIGGTGANEGVLIQNSGQQGILFRTQSPISVSALRNLGTQVYPGGAQNDPNTPNIIRARLNIVNSQVIANGTVGNVNSDGVVLAVGTNTQQDVLMAGNAINGNVLDDLRIFSFASLNTQNDSVDNPVAVPGPNDLLRLDPIARLGLVFGSIQSAYDSTTVPPMTNPQTTPLIPQGLFPSQAPNPIVLATRNTGEQINVTTTGSAATAGIANSNGTFTTGGVFTNAGRPTGMNGQVQIGQFPGPGLSDTSTFADSRNQFVQFLIEQDVDGAFAAGGFTLNPANVFP